MNVDNIYKLIRNNDIDALKELSSVSYNFNHVFGLSRMSLLHFACECGHIEVIKILLSSRDIDINAKNVYGHTPLYYACWNGYDEILKLLISNGAVLDVTDNNGNTPLHTACHFGRIEIVKILIENKANVHSIDNKGNTPLRRACLSGHTEVVKILLSNGANVNNTDLNNITSLYSYCCHRIYGDIVRILIENGASISIPYKRGLKPRCFCCKELTEQSEELTKGVYQ